MEDIKKSIERQENLLQFSNASLYVFISYQIAFSSRIKIPSLYTKMYFYRSSIGCFQCFQIFSCFCLSVASEPHTVFSSYVFWIFCSTRQIYYRNQIGHLCIRDMSLVNKPYRHVTQLKHIVGNLGDRNQKIYMYSDSNYYRIEVVKSSTSLVQKDLTQFCNPNLGSRKAIIIIEIQK